MEVKEGLRITSNGEEHYTLCCNQTLEVMEGGTLIFGQPVSLMDDSPVTITIQSLENWDNILSLEITPVF